MDRLIPESSLYVAIPYVGMSYAVRSAITFTAVAELLVKIVIAAVWKMRSF